MMRTLVAVLLALTIGLYAAAGGLTIVAPAAPGGGWDQTARVMQQVFARVEPGSSVQVENVPGAAGTIGLARFVTSERGNPDALLVTGLVMVSGIITNRAPVSLADTTPIARLTGEWEIVVVPADSRWQTLADLLAAFEASPASVTWGGGSAGGTDDLLVRLIAQAVGVSPNQANYIAFPGGGAALAALLGGQVAAGVSGYSEFAGQIQSGTLRLLAVSAPTRVAGIEAPTLREQGVALDLANWRGIVAPPGLTVIERDRLTARVERMAASDEWKAVLARHGWSDLLLTGPAFRQFLIAEQQRIEQVLRSLESANTSPAASLRLTPSTLPSLTLIMGSGLILISAYRAVRLNRTKNSSRSPRPNAPPISGTGSNVADVAGTQFRALRPTPLGGTQFRAIRPTPLWMIAVLAGHAVGMPVIGFVPASTLLFALAAGLLGSHRWMRDAGIGAAIAVVLYLAFTLGLGLDLPRDPLTRWLAR